MGPELPECAGLSALAMHPECVQRARTASARPLALALPPWLRAYVHCARRGPPGALAAVLINLNAADAVDVSMERIPHAPSPASTAGGAPPAYRGRRVEHELWARELNSTHALQGAGRRLTLDALGGATNLEERAVPAGAGPVRVRAWSVLFVELPDARAPQCLLGPQSGASH